MGTDMVSRCKSKGFGLLELMVVLVIAVLLVSVAIPAYDQYAERARVSKAIADVSSLSLAVEGFRLNNSDRIPDTLAELGIDVPTDPWGNAYEYLNIANAGGGNADFRKDGKLNPLNTDFDLYSAGKDGESAGPLSADKSRDDIVRANDGAFIGLGEDY